MFDGTQPFQDLCDVVELWIAEKFSFGESELPGLNDVVPETGFRTMEGKTLSVIY